MRGFNAVRAAVAVLGIMAFASGAWAQTGSEGTKLNPGQWTGGRGVVVNPADSLQHVQRGDASGYSYSYDPRSAIVLSASNIINNYASKTAPGVADSSIAYPLNGAKNLSIRLYTTANDSAAAIKHQLLYLSWRYGTGTVADSTGGFPQVTLRSPGNVSGGAADTVYAATASGWLYGSRDAIFNAQAGEVVVQCQTVATAGQRYVTIDLPPPAHGETHISIRTRTGPVQYYTGPLNGASKWTMGTRVDVRGTR